MNKQTLKSDSITLKDIHNVVYNFTNLELSSIFIYKELLSQVHKLIQHTTVSNPEKDILVRTLQKIENDLQIWESLKQYTFQDKNTYNFISISDEKALAEEKTSVDNTLYQIKSSVSLAN